MASTKPKGHAAWRKPNSSVRQFFLPCSVRASWANGSPMAMWRSLLANTIATGAALIAPAIRPSTSSPPNWRIHDVLIDVAKQINKPAAQVALNCANLVDPFLVPRVELISFQIPMLPDSKQGSRRPATEY